jgi:DNA replication initiation complex subunit (GINS family)
MLNLQKPVMVKFKKTLHGLSDYSPNLSEPVEEGYETTVPRWLAEWLVDKGYAEYVSAQAGLKQQLARNIWQEEQGNYPQKLPEDFYAELKRPIEEMMKSNDPGFSTVQSMLQDLLRMRAKKIRRMAESNTRPSAFESLSPEEKAWFEEYRALFQDWIEPLWFMYPSGFKIDFWLSLND